MSGDFQTWNSAPAGGSRRPWVYGITFRMPPPWLSRCADRASLAVDRDFSLDEIGGIYRYDFRLRIAADGVWFSNAHLWSFNIAPRDRTICLAKPFFIPAGGVLEVDALPPAKFHWRSNPISIRFIGQVAV